MTRKSLHRRLFLVSAFLISLIVASFFAKTSANVMFSGFYDFIKDMSLLIATLMAAYLAHIFQKRSSFLQSLREEWREIVMAKSELTTYCDCETPMSEGFILAYREISCCIDLMRIVYRNVGETQNLVGLYPYEPLHDMRRAMEEIDPRSSQNVTQQDHLEARKKIQAAFAALREHFLDEFDLEPPTTPILAPGAARKKQSGASLSIWVARKLRKSGVKL